MKPWRVECSDCNFKSDEIANYEILKNIADKHSSSTGHKARIIRRVGKRTYELL